MPTVTKLDRLKAIIRGVRPGAERPRESSQAREELRRSAEFPPQRTRLELIQAALDQLRERLDAMFHSHEIPGNK